MKESNKDTYNITFLISYNLFKNTDFINNEIKNLIDDTNRDKSLDEYNKNLTKINEDKFNQSFNDLFNYIFLITDKLKKI